MYTGIFRVMAGLPTPLHAPELCRHYNGNYINLNWGMHLYLKENGLEDLSEEESRRYPLSENSKIITAGKTRLWLSEKGFSFCLFSVMYRILSKINYSQFESGYFWTFFVPVIYEKYPQKPLNPRKNVRKFPLQKWPKWLYDRIFAMTISFVSSNWTNKIRY